MLAPIDAAPPSYEEELAAAGARLAERTGCDAADVRAVVSPYRICPLGAHSDHQGGTVLGMAISAYTVLAWVPAADGRLTVTYDPRGETAQFPLAEPPAPPAGDWRAYAAGAARLLADRLPERPRGLEAVVRGSLPGAGLSSSASVDLAYLSAIAAANDLELAPRELAVRALRVETEVLGLGCGLLDPASIVGARRGHLLRIECRAGTWSAVPPGRGLAPYRILIAFSGTTRQLVATGFNDRVAECRSAARRIGELTGQGEVSILGELPPAVIEAHLDRLPPAEANRARHFASEARRVEAGLEAWKHGDLAGFGHLMDASCRSSIQNYECGSPEIVALHEILATTDGVLGNRFSGGGYGGCCIAFVEQERAEEATRRACETYLERYPHLESAARFFLATSEDGIRCW